MSASDEHDKAAAAALRKRRNVWLALALAALVVLIGGVTMARIGSEATKPEGGFYYRVDETGKAPPNGVEPAQ